MTVKLGGKLLIFVDEKWREGEVMADWCVPWSDWLALSLHGQPQGGEASWLGAPHCRTSSVAVAAAETKRRA